MLSPRVTTHLPQPERRLTLKNGREVTLRPILPSDGPGLVDLFGRMSAQSLYLRFLQRLPALPEALLQRLLQVDYDRAFALVAVSREAERDALVAVARYAQARPGEPADLALAVRDDWQQLGLGKALMSALIEIGKAHGLAHFGSMMDPHNQRMRHILTALGYRVRYSAQDGLFQVDIRV